MRKLPLHQTNTVLSWVGWSWLKRTKGEDCRLALSVNYSLSRRTRIFSRQLGPTSESCAMRLTMDSKSTGNPTRVGAATTLFSIFVTRCDFPTRSEESATERSNGAFGKSDIEHVAIENRAGRRQRSYRSWRKHRAWRVINVK